MPHTESKKPVWHKTLIFKIIFPVIIASLLGAIAIGTLVPVMQSQSIESTAIFSAENTAKQFKTLRKYYVENILSKVLNNSSISAKIEHKNSPDSIPLPATMIHDISNLVSKDGMSLSLYSPYPFPNRKDRQLDVFAQEAWQFLQKNPDQSFSKTVEKDGRTIVRTAIADTMVNETCTGCHNAHPLTPKTGWEVDDVRGVLEITTEIDEQLAMGVVASQWVLLIIAIVSLSSVALTWLLLKKRVNHPIQQALALAASVKASDFNSEIEVTSNDETAHLMHSLIDMRNYLKKAADNDSRMTELTRINLALESVSSSVLLIDEQCKILYMNHSASQLINSICQSDPDESVCTGAQSLLGSDISCLYNTDSNHVKNNIGKLGQTEKVSYVIGQHTLEVINTPIFSQEQSRIGTVVEWLDRTQELAIENEVQEIVDSALEGELQKRIDCRDKQGFIKVLSERVNELVHINQRVIDDTVHAMSAVSQGDLTQRIESQFKGSFEQLKININNTIDKLTEVTQEINGSTEVVLSGSQEISEGNSTLRQRTEAQAASLEETASSMEQLTATVRQNADYAHQADELAMSASEQAMTGCGVVNNAVSAMSDITDASKKIADITGVIDEIAFQTNLLALNAAVEAARAGEQGRGFAVVASEVRNLASRSATAAREIKDLIQNSVTKIEEGSKLVNESGSTLEDIMNSVKKVSDIIGDIATASQEQSEGISQINLAINQMDQTTQQNASLVEQAELSSTTMAQHAASLSKLIRFFSANDHHKASDQSTQKQSPMTSRFSNEREPGFVEKDHSSHLKVVQTRFNHSSPAENQEWESF